METIYLSLRAQVAVGTFFMKSPLYTIYLSLCTQTAGPNHHRGTHYISLNLNLFQTYPLPARLPGYLIKYKQISDISVTAAGLLGQLVPNIHILYLSVTRTSTLCISIFFFIQTYPLPARLPGHLVWHLLRSLLGNLLGGRRSGTLQVLWPGNQVWHLKHG